MRSDEVFGVGTQEYIKYSLQMWIFDANITYDAWSHFRINSREQKSIVQTNICSFFSYFSWYNSNSLNDKDNS